MESVRDVASSYDRWDIHTRCDDAVISYGILDLTDGRVYYLCAMSTVDEFWSDLLWFWTVQASFLLLIVKTHLLRKLAYCNYRIKDLIV